VKLTTDRVHKDIISPSLMSKIISLRELMFTCGCLSSSKYELNQEVSPISAPTEVIALENTLNGTIYPQTEIVAISEYAHSLAIKMHLDGARIWHVAAETDTHIKELCDPFDSVSLCFSKGLGEYYKGRGVLLCLYFLKVLLLDLAWLAPKSLLPERVGSESYSEEACARQASLRPPPLTL
jgi:hypothetical protein